MTKGPQRLVLVVDPDPGAAAALGPALRREGYQVRIARDGARALQLAVIRVPDLMLIDEGTPVLAPRTLVRILRSNPRTTRMPILFAGGDPEKLPEGANAFARKPLHTDDLLAAIRRLVAEAGVDTREAERVEGSLSQLPLPDVLQMLGNNRRTGQLLVSGDALRAEITFEQGEIVDAAAGAVVGEKVLARVLALREGKFVFQPGEGGTARSIERSLTELLLEGLALSDEMAVLARQLPPRDAVLERVAREEGATDILEVVGPTEDEVRTLLVTPQRVGDVLDRSSATDLLTARAILGLLSSGEVLLVETRPVAAEPAAPVVSEADAQALRARLRRGSGTGSTVGKLVIAGGDAATRRATVERISGLSGFRASPENGQPFGTLGALHLADLRLDLVLLPDDPTLSPLWGPLAAGALGALLLGSIQLDDEAVSNLVRTARMAVGWCGTRPTRATIRGGDDEGYLGPDPCEALRTLVARAASRARPS